MTEEKNRGQSGGVNISGGKVHVGGDVVGGDKSTIGNIGAGASVAQGRGAQANVTNVVGGAMWDDWRKQMFEWVEKQPNMSPADKQDVKDNIEKIQAEAKKGEQADPQRLERFINTLALIGPDIFEVTVATIQNPLLGIGLVLKKIADKAKLERTPMKPA